MKAKNLSPKRKSDALQIVKRSTELKCTKNILRSISLPQLLQSSMLSISEEFSLTLRSLYPRALQKASEQTLFCRAFAEFVYPFGIIWWGRRFDPGPVARWCNSECRTYTLKCCKLQSSYMRQAWVTSWVTSPGSFYAGFTQHKSAFISQPFP